MEVDRSPGVPRHSPASPSIQLWGFASPVLEADAGERNLACFPFALFFPQTCAAPWYFSFVERKSFG